MGASAVTTTQRRQRRVQRVEAWRVPQCRHGLQLEVGGLVRALVAAVEALVVARELAQQAAHDELLAARVAPALQRPQRALLDRQRALRHQLLRGRARCARELPLKSFDFALALPARVRRVGGALVETLEVIVERQVRGHGEHGLDW
jgi:hypothetical protein